MPRLVTEAPLSLATDMAQSKTPGNARFSSGHSMLRDPNYSWLTLSRGTVGPAAWVPGDNSHQVAIFSQVAREQFLLLGTKEPLYTVMPIVCDHGRTNCRL